MATEPGLLQLPKGVQEHILQQIRLEELMRVALTCRALHTAVMAAPPKLWQQAVMQHLPWHPLIALGLASAPPCRGVLRPAGSLRQGCVS